LEIRLNFSSPFIERPIATFYCPSGCFLVGLWRIDFSPSRRCPTSIFRPSTWTAIRPGAILHHGGDGGGAAERRLGEIPGVVG